MRKKVLVSFLLVLLCTSACSKSIDNSSEESSSEATIAESSNEEASMDDKNEIDPVSQKIVNDIEKIGDVDLDDEDSINRLTELYGTLTDEQKKQVSNYIDLVNAQDAIKELKKNAEEQEEIITEELDDEKTSSESELSSEHVLKEELPASQAQYIGYTGTYVGEVLLSGGEGNILTINVNMYDGAVSEDEPFGEVYIKGDAGEDSFTIYLESTDTQLTTGFYDAIFMSSNGRGDYLYYGFADGGMTMDYLVKGDSEIFVIASLTRQE